MSNPSDQHVDDPGTIGDTGGRDHAGEAKEYGGAAERVVNAPEAGAADSPTQSLSLSSAFELLVESVTAMEGRGSLTTAAGVSALMKKTRPDFAVGDLAYPSFRRFIEAAAQQGLVEIEWAPSGSDLILHSHSAGSMPRRVSSGATVSSPATSPSTRRIRPDLWRAFSASTADGHFLFDRRSSTTTFRSGPPLDDATASLVPILPVSTLEKVEWMRAFADRQTDPEIRSSLLAALEADSSGENFRTTARENQTLMRRWSRHYRNQILDRVDSWAAANSVPSASIEVRPEPSRVWRDEPTSRAIPPAPMATPGGRSRASDSADLQRLRALVCRAVNEMPLSDLLRLPIPAEYLLLRQ